MFDMSAMAAAAAAVGVAAAAAALGVVLATVLDLCPLPALCPLRFALLVFAFPRRARLFKAARSDRVGVYPS